MQPDKRITIDEIREHPWMKGEMASKEELINDFKEREKKVLSALALQ